MRNFKRFHAALLIAGALALAACATVPDLGAAPNAKETANLASSNSFAAPQASWPGDTWWSAYADPQLTDLIEVALKGAPTLAQAQARIAKSEAARGEARAADLPTLEADGSYSE